MHLIKDLHVILGGDDRTRFETYGVEAANSLSLSWLSLKIIWGIPLIQTLTPFMEGLGVWKVQERNSNSAFSFSSMLVEGLEK